MNSRLLILFFVIVSCSSSKKSTNDSTNQIVERYGIDLVSSQELAAKLAEAIWTEKYINDDIQLYKPFEVKLIENGKVWEITGNSPNKGNIVMKRTYHMKINKNTAEVLRNWVEK